MSAVFSDATNPAGDAPEAKRKGDCVIRIEHLTKKFGRITAVDDLSLEVSAGRLFGFLGPNGAGKSTTIGCLTGLLDPTAGSIRLLGEALIPHSVEIKRRIGVMPEGLALFDQLRAPEFLAFNARMFGLDEKTTRGRVEELLEAMDLKSALQRPLREFSAGMRKKVAFAASIIHHPEILFLDEPFESIDPSATAMMKEWLRRYVAQGCTVFMTSHVLETVERLCDDVGIIHFGKLAWRGELKNLSGGGDIECDGRRFATLEALFLHIAGEQHRRLSWL